MSLTTRDELSNFLRTHSVVIVKFTATWCGPCKRSTPLVNELYNKMPDKSSQSERERKRNSKKNKSQNQIYSAKHVRAKESLHNKPNIKHII